MDGNGNAIIVYDTYDTATNTISLWSQRYTPESGWASAALLSNNNDNGTYSYYYSLAVSANGDAIVVYWVRDAAASYSLWGRRYTPASGWASAVLLSSNNSSVRQGSIAMDANGNAIIIYRVYDETYSVSLWSQRYTSGSGWGNAVFLSNTESNSIAMDANGNAIVVYGNIVARHYVPGAGWNTEILLSDGSGSTSSASDAIVMSPSGTATVTWVQGDGTGKYQLWSNHYAP